jgi:hypothetical protein
MWKEFWLGNVSLYIHVLSLNKRGYYLDADSSHFYQHCMICTKLKFQIVHIIQQNFLKELRIIQNTVLSYLVTIILMGKPCMTVLIHRELEIWTDKIR